MKKIMFQVKFILKLAQISITKSNIYYRNINLFFHHLVLILLAIIASMTLCDIFTSTSPAVEVLFCSSK